MGKNHCLIALNLICLISCFSCGPINEELWLSPASFTLKNLTMCAMVRDEMPYILEWIEFYRLQGVDHFVLYDDGSVDDTVLLSHFYNTVDLTDLVEVLPTNTYRNNAQLLHHHEGHHGQTQMYVLDHCNRRMSNRSEWIIVVDVDEFIFPTEHETIWEFIKSKKNETDVKDDSALMEAISQYTVLAIRYGTSGLEHDFRGQVSVDPYRATAVVHTTGFDASGNLIPGFPMISVANPNRAPESHLDVDFTSRHNETCRAHTHPNGCNHNLGKSIWKPERCGMSGVHWCERGLKGRTYMPTVRELRENHYAFKTRQHVEGLIALMKGDKMAAYTNFDETWFSSRSDPMPDRLVRLINDSLSRFTEAL